MPLQYLRFHHLHNDVWEQLGMIAQLLHNFGIKLYHLHILRSIGIISLDCGILNFKTVKQFHVPGLFIHNELVAFVIKYAYREVIPS